MSTKEELYKEKLFEELNCEEDMEIVGGNVYTAISGVINNICISIKEKLFD